MYDSSCTNLLCSGQPAWPGVGNWAAVGVLGEGHLGREPGRHQAEGPGQVQVKCWFIETGLIG